MNRIITILMLTAVVVACSRKEQIEAPKTYTMTIEAVKGAPSRLLVLENENDPWNQMLNCYWQKGDNVTVISPNSNKEMEVIGSLTAQGDGKNTMLTGSLTQAPGEMGLALVYPRFPIDYSGQDGTLGSISAKYDYSTCFQVSGITIDQGIITSSTIVNFNSYQAIVRFCLQNTNDEPINATSLTISEANNRLIIYSDTFMIAEPGDIIINLNPASSEIWASLYSYSSNLAITLTANDGTHTYTCSQQGVTWSPGKFYSIDVTMDLVE